MTDTDKFSAVVDACGFTSVAPMPSDQELKNFYENVYYQLQASTTYKAVYSEQELAQKRLRAGLLVHAVKSLGVPSGKFLDVGCGEGFLLAVAQDAGFDTHGIEFSSFGVSKFNPLMISRVQIGNAFEILDQLIEGGAVADVCSLQNVLEHVVDPRALLSRIRKVIGSEGVAVITVPNDFSLVQEKIKALGLVARDYWWAPPQHLHYFNSDNLPRFVEELGLKVLDAYGDFPVELFLFHRGSNYTLSSEAGPDAHNARVELDLLLAQKGIANYHAFCKAMTACGFGRNVTVIVKAE
jgi:2-polyprenyl-3-methyl-5-hydroxy-6-metoxy-1,4-benzoquinol methylase